MRPGVDYPGGAEGFPGPPPGAKYPGQITLKAAVEGYTPNYKNIIESSSGYQAAAAAAKAAEHQGAINRRAAIRQALIRYGGATNWTDTYKDIDQATRDLAAQNQTSTLAGLQRGLATSQMDLRRGLAARGMLQSGDLGYGEDQLNTQYAQARYDAANQLGDLLSGYVGTYSDILGQNRKDLSNAVATEEASAYTNPAYQPVKAVPGIYADYNAGASAAYGKPLYSYQNDKGVITYYDADGNVVVGSQNY